MKLRHWLLCFAVALWSGWLIGKLCVMMAMWQINRHFDDLHTQLLTLQSNITAQIRASPPIVLPNPWVTNIVVTNLWLTNTLSTLLVTNHGVWIRVATNTPPLP